MMSAQVLGLLRVARDGAMNVAQVMVVGLALILTAATVAALAGGLPWPELALSVGGTAVPDAGMWGQIALTVLALLLCFYLPANARMSRLERSHRSFAMGMDDVARAYRLAHAADRAGVFALSSEFDAMRARMEHLRNHPDLGHLEPELLQMAAQMSHHTRDLARAYSDTKVARAREFLKQRQEEVHALTDRLAAARLTVDELRRWLTDVEAEERRAEVQIRRLEADLRELLPGLGWHIEGESLRDDIGRDPGRDLPRGDAGRDDNVVQLPKPLN